MKFILISTILVMALLGASSVDKFETFQNIEISKAEHLGDDRNFISDIYDKVYQLDNIWSEPIYNNEYVRVRFEKNLTNKNDITIYPRINSGNPRIEVYEIDENEIIAEFPTINPNKYNKVFLTNLIGEQDTFDLRVLDGDIEIDHIIDPTENFIVNGDFNTDNSSWLFVIVATGKVNGYEWVNTGRTGGSVHMWDGDRNSIAVLDWRQTFNVNSSVINGLTDANLSFCYNISTYLTIDSYNVNVSLVNPSSADSIVWNHPVSGLEPWTCVSVNVTSIFTEAGDYVLRLTHHSDIGNSGTLKLAETYWDDVVLNMDYTPAAPPSNTCTAPGSGDWNITCSDYCNWTDSLTVPDNITITESGILTLSANMNFSKKNWEIYKEDGCEFVVNSGGSIG